MRIGLPVHGGALSLSSHSTLDTISVSQPTSLGFAAINEIWSLVVPGNVVNGVVTALLESVIYAQCLNRSKGDVIIVFDSDSF